MLISFCKRNNTYNAIDKIHQRLKAIQQYLLDSQIIPIHIMTIIAFVSICYIGISENFSFSFTKNWFIIVWQKENNFPISRRRKMVHCRSPSSFVRKWQFTSLLSSDGEKRHHSYDTYTIVTCEIIHIENVQCSTEEWP